MTVKLKVKVNAKVFERWFSFTFLKVACDYDLCLLGLHVGVWGQHVWSGGLG